MKQNMMDDITERILRREKGVSEKLSHTFKNTPMYGEIPFKKEEVLFHVQRLTPQDYEYLIAKNGAESVYRFLGMVEKLRKEGQIY